MGTKKKIVAFDLETIADKAMIPFLPEVKAKSNLKDPVKITADLDEKKKKQLQDMGISPMTNLICCAGWADNNNETGSIVLGKEEPQAEKYLIEQFWDLLSKYD